MTKFLDVFTPIQKGNFGLTDEAIYKSIQHGGLFIPVWGGTQEHTTIDRLVSEYGKSKYDVPVTIFNGDGIIISLDGSAGCMTYVTGKRFALNHHAGFFQVKEEAKQLVDPEFFSLFYAKQLQETSISEGSKTLTLTMIESMDFDVPQYDVQKKIMSEIRPILKAKEKVNNLLTQINSIKERVLSVEYEDYQAKDIPISEVLNCYGGNTGLTEEGIYQKILLDGERYEVLSSSTKEDTRMGRVPICSINGKKLDVFEDKEGILVIRNGKAGTTFFLNKGKYAITDHAYILSLKESCKYVVSLKWLMFQYRHSFLDYVSTSPNATWNMTGFFKEVKIHIPSYEEQLELAKKYDYLELLQSRIEGILRKIDPLFTRQIVA
jgi:restriction endonuclease S subunit